MEFETHSVLIDKKVLDNIVINLKKIRDKATEQEIICLATEALDSMKNSNEEGTSGGLEGETLVERIKYKMRTTKDKDLNLKLYMLYRKLEEGKIPEVEALKLYELYLETEYTDQFV